MLDQIIAAGGRDDLNVLHPVEHGKFPKCRTVTPQLVGVNDLWNVVFPQQPLEERTGRLGIPVFLKEDVQHGSVFIHGST